jgi:hypothetical protein
MPNKFAHIRSDRVDPRDPNSSHECLWPDCHIQVPRSHWGCREHWETLPKALRNGIWQAYELGQEDHPDRMTEAYIVACEAAQSWIRTYRVVQR